MFTAERQSKLTPAKVIKILGQGNEEFINNKLTIKNTTERVRRAANGQYPAAVVVSCLDSRVPVEDIFHCGLGDIFVARIAGNIVNSDILGSMEFACNVSGSKLVVVLGHSDCGAVKLAIDGGELGNMTGLLDKIRPAVNLAKTNFKGETTSSNPEFFEIVCRTNITLMVNTIRHHSPILKEMEDKGAIKIVGAMYDIPSGKVEFFLPTFMPTT